MSIITHHTKQLKLYGAALALSALILTVLAVSLTGGAQAQDGPRIGENTEEYSAPYPCSEEAVPGPRTVRLIRDGYYAVFDAFWDYEVGHLSNNFCPPKVTVATKEVDEEVVTVHTRSNANIHISETAFSVPDSYQATVVDSGATDDTSGSVTGTTIDLADFPFLDGAVSAGDSVYWVRLDDPDTAGTDETSPLKVGFSTALMEEADWYSAEGDPVQFRFSAVHVLQDGTPQEAHVQGAHLFAFDQRDADTAVEYPLWSNVETIERSEITMRTGQYRPMQFVFTKPGQYLVQVNVEGHVRKEDNRLDDAPDGWSPISPDDSITSPVQWYTFHVGPEADLSAGISFGDVVTNNGVSTVPMSIDATNLGPGAAENVEIEVNLPAGLTPPATIASGITSNGCGVVAWRHGGLAAYSAVTHTSNVQVDSGATGNLTATAEIRSTTYDTHPGNNSASAELALGGVNVRPPFFTGLSRSIVEHGGDGAHAGDPVAAVSPEGRRLTYSLSGRCSNKFRVHPNGQIVLAAGQSLDYKQQWEYPLTLHVSDGVNASGNADTSVDDSTAVLIRVEDTDPDAIHPTVTFTLHNSHPDTQPNLDLNHPLVRQWIDLHASLHDLPAGVEPTYSWYVNGARDPNGNGSAYLAYSNRPGTVTYTVHVKWPGGGITASYEMEWFSQ